MTPVPFADLPHTPHQHFALYFYAAILRVLDQASDHFGSAEAAHERFPFLAGYFEEMAGHGLRGATFADAHAWWRGAIDRWEAGAPGRLPLAALRRAADLAHDDLALLLQVALPDEDPRLGALFDELQGGVGQNRPSIATLAAAWQHAGDIDARVSIHRLEALGLIDTAPDPHATIRPNGDVWDAVRGAAEGVPGWGRYRSAAALPDIDDLVLPASVRTACRDVPALVAAGAMCAVVIRGPQHNGRGTLAAALARGMRKGLIEIAGLDGATDPRWRSAASLAHLLDAALLTTAELAPSESFTLPDWRDGLAPLFVTLGTAGGVRGGRADRATTIWIPVPERTARERLWSGVLGSDAPSLAGARLTSGNIVRAARLTRASQAANSTPHLEVSTLRAAVRSLERPGLEALARRVNPASDWSRLAVSPDTLAELTTLEARCRHRERLGAFVGEALEDLGPGVRALFKGPSGTGKTLAARMLAGALQMDLYRVDLSAVVNKYIGETEKGLERVFACAEELDVILLLDEGDALLTQRTGVQNANDRYANLETNYLLQRLETFEGILLITTNAADRIDSAFQRRMDVVIDFALPDAAERWAIWQIHLPASHQVEQDLINAAAERCTLSGGQIRNAALHASLLAVEAGAPVTARHLEAAIAREYRAAGGLSPLRSRAGVR